VIPTATEPCRGVALFDKRLRWAETFISTRSKLLELISFDTWLNEMLAIIEQEGRDR
jgi:hypothetical protein